jgi:DNA-binding transcriptional ArsR family regulator
MNAVMNASPDLEAVAEPRRAGVLLRPLRVKILGLAREPASATELARRLRLPRQRVNYHVRELARAGFLRRAGRRRRRNMIEQRYQASARAYVLDPALLGPVGAGTGTVGDALSAAALLALASRAQSEVARGMREAAAQRRRLATLSIEASVRFEGAAQRERFARALHEAVTEVVARHTSPFRRPEGGLGPGRPYRLFLGCYPIPPGPDVARAPEEG